MAEIRTMTTSKILFWIGEAVILLMGGVMAIFWNKLPPQLPWFYSFPWGEQQLVYKLWFVWIFAGMGVILFLSRIIANWAGKDDKTVQNVVMIGVFVAVVLMFASFSRVMMIFLNS